MALRWYSIPRMHRVQHAHLQLHLHGLLAAQKKVGPVAALPAGRYEPCIGRYPLTAGGKAGAALQLMSSKPLSARASPTRKDSLSEGLLETPGQRWTRL